MIGIIQRIGMATELSQNSFGKPVLPSTSKSWAMASAGNRSASNMMEKTELLFHNQNV